MPFYSSLYKHLITLKIGLQRPDDDQAAFRKFYQQFKSIWSSTFSGEHNQDDGRNEFLFLFDVMDIYIDRQSDCEYLRPKAIQEVERLIVQQESFTPTEAAHQKLLSKLCKPLYQVNIDETKQAFEEFSKGFMEDIMAAITA